MHGRSIVLVAALAALISSQLRAQETISPADSAGLAELRYRWTEAYNEGNASALTRFYVDDAVRMPYDAPTQRGRDSIIAAYRASFGRRALVPTLLLEKDEVHVENDWALERGVYREVLRPRGGGVVLVEEGKYVGLARRGEDSLWRYVWSIFNRDAPAHPIDQARHTLSADQAVAESEAWLRAGRIDRGLALLDSAALRLQDPRHRRARGRVLGQRGELLAFQVFLTGQGYGEASLALSEAREIATEFGDLGQLSKALLFTGFAEYARVFRTSVGDYATPNSFFEQALELRRQLGDTRGEAEALFYLGIIHERRDDVDGALELYRQSLELARTGGHRLEESYAVRHVSFIMQARGQLDSSLAGFQRSLDLREEAGFRIYVPFSHLAVGDVLLQMANPSGALEHYEAGLEVARELDIGMAIVFCLVSRGDALLELGNDVEARRAFVEAQDTAVAIDFQSGAEVARQRLEGLSDGGDS